MNTVSTIGQTMAMDGRSNYSSSAEKTQRKAVNLPTTGTIPNSAAEVTENIAKNLAEIQSDAKELERLSDMVMGRKLLFNVNEDSGQVVVKVVDSSTKEVIREIPSEDLQKLRARLKQTNGILFDEVI